jgi:protein-S-isoprenylcysteine O-methyltransferase Ste14
MTRRVIKRAAIRHREELVGEHPLGDAGQLVLALLFGAVWIADTFFLHYTTFLNQYVPLAVRLPLALAFLLVAGYLAWTGMAIMFGEKREEPRVVEKGVYGLVRHPIYLGEILVYLGSLLLSISLAAVIVWLVAIAFLHYISRYEEKLLLEQRGRAYEEYMREVPMWVPRPWRG